MCVEGDNLILLSRDYISVLRLSLSWLPLVTINRTCCILVSMYASMKDILCWSSRCNSCVNVPGDNIIQDNNLNKLHCTCDTNWSLPPSLAWPCLLQSGGEWSIPGTQPGRNRPFIAGVLQDIVGEQISDTRSFPFYVGQFLSSVSRKSTQKLN